LEYFIRCKLNIRSCCHSCGLACWSTRHSASFNVMQVDI